MLARTTARTTARTKNRRDTSNRTAAQTRTRRERLNKKPYSTDSTLNYIKHSFSQANAAKRFADKDQNRLFAPNISLPEEKNALQISMGNPLKEVFVPYFGVTAKIPMTRYTGRYGIDHITFSTYTDKDGHTHITTNIETHWHNISGTLSSSSYYPNDDQMIVYGGFTWPRSLMEKAMSGYHFTDQLIPFDPATVNNGVMVDPFLRKAALTHGIFYERIRSYESTRAKHDVNKRIKCDHVEINELFYDFSEFKLSSFLLPAYILQYSNWPPRILPAFNAPTKIVGPAPLSSVKVGTVVGVVATFASFFLAPPLAISARIAWVAASAMGGGLLAKYNLTIRNTWQQSSIAKEKEENESVAESFADKNRRETTEGFTSHVKQKEPTDLLEVEEIYFQILDLDPSKPVTEKMVTDAFNHKIKKIHPDVNKAADPEETRVLIEARNRMHAALKKKKHNFGNGKRFYSTRATQIKNPPDSKYHHRANELITAVLDKKDYQRAIRLVRTEEIHPDFHDKNENTLLTEAAKRGDLKAIEFAIKELGANPDSSCDCPLHNTALHYAAFEGNATAVELLLTLNANPNLINSYGKTILDIAILNQDEKLQKLLKQHGALQHVTLENRSALDKVKGFFGYRSSERTLLLFKDKQDTALPKSEENKVIHLPAPKK